MNYKVYQANNPTFGFGTQPKFPEEYTLVATVNADGLDEVFESTNNIDKLWTQNENIVMLHKLPTPNGIRSTSVGDVVVDEAGVAHYCDMVGWKELETA